MRRMKIERPLAKLRTADEREGGYPSVGDQLDALWKGFAALADGKAPPVETAAPATSEEAKPGA